MNNKTVVHLGVYTTGVYYVDQQTGQEHRVGYAMRGTNGWRAYTNDDRVLGSFRTRREAVTYLRGLGALI